MIVSVRVLTLASIYQAGAAAALWLISLLVWPTLHLGVLLGAGLMGVNFLAFRWLSGKAMRAENRKAAYAIALSAKLVAVMGLMALLVLVFDINAVGIAIGMSTLFVGIGLGTAHQAFSPPAAPADMQ